MKKRFWSVTAKLILTVLVFSALSKGAFFGFEYVIDVLAEQRLLTEVAQTAQVIKNTLDQFQLAQTMASEVTHASYWKSVLMQIILNPPRNLYGETNGWDQVFTGGANVNSTWNNSTIPVEQDRYYTNGPGSTFASTAATAEVADSTAQDSLAAVQQFYQNKPINASATQSLQADFQSGANNTYLGQVRITNGIGFQTLSTQQDALTQLTNLTRIETVLLKQVRDQNADANNFITDLHQYQAAQGVSIGGGLAAEFQAYSLP
jgi:hypothetical protein